MACPPVSLSINLAAEETRIRQRYDSAISTHSASIPPHVRAEHRACETHPTHPHHGPHQRQHDALVEARRDGGGGVRARRAPCMRQSWLARTVRFTVLLLSVDLALAMRIVLQRVKSASVTVEDAVVSSINRGVLALVGLREGDTTADLEYCAKKLCAAKLWANEEGKGWRKAARQLDYEVLLVSRLVETSRLLQRASRLRLGLVAWLVWLSRTP